MKSPVRVSARVVTYVCMSVCKYTHPYTCAWPRVRQSDELGGQHTVGSSELNSGAYGLDEAMRAAVVRST